MEKTLKYNVTTYCCFIDLQNAFDRVELNNIIHLIYKRNMLSDLIKTIENIYSRNSIQTRNNNKLTEPIPVERDIRQGNKTQTQKNKINGNV